MTYRNESKFHPDSALRCLLVQPRFSDYNFWNYVDTAALIGAKTPGPPLSLMTVAAILPQHWQFTIVDLNVREMDESAWEAADLVCVGGMLSQQRGILEIIHRAKSEGKFVAVGGADPTSQPDVYADANARVIGEGEMSIPLWLDQWRNSGNPAGLFTCKEKPDVKFTPTPRFDLIDFNNYVHIGVQFSRGCPFNCEFCDIIELYGRVPRTKSPEQFLSELQRLYELGYRGWVDIVDDNFIGNKRLIKKMLVELELWSKDRNYPFYFSTEASMNLADDEPLMAAMQACDFRFVFMGIETPDPEILLQTQKSQNTMQPIVERVQNLYRHGMMVSAGYILGFDGEKKGIDHAMVRCIEESGTVLAMVGLLTALPNTQLTRRLHREGRLLSTQGTIVDPREKLAYRVGAESFAATPGGDQTSSGLNYVTMRNRVEIFDEYLKILRAVYNPRAFFDRVLRTTKQLKLQRKHQARGKYLVRNVLGLMRAIWCFSRMKNVSYFYWRNFFKTMMMGPQHFEAAQNITSMYVHMHKTLPFIESQINKRRELSLRQKSFPLLHESKKAESTFALKHRLNVDDRSESL